MISTAISFSKATKDYIIWLDADDVIDEKNRQALLILKEQLDVLADVVMMKYDVAFDENDVPTFSFYRERIVKREKQFQWVGQIHEVIVPTGNILYEDIAISHKRATKEDPERNLKIFSKMLSNGKTLEPRQQFYYARELYYNGKYESAIDTFNTFLEEGRGWVENNISACQNLYSCYHAIGEAEMALLSLFKSFSYDLPRAETCCDIAGHFFNLGNYKQAIFWYKLATTLEPNHESGAFYLPDCYGYTPFMQLCVCYDKLGDYKTAAEFNEKAGKIKQQSSAYDFNKKYFNKIEFE